MNTTVPQGVKRVVRATLNFEDEETRQLTKEGLRDAGFDIKIEQDLDGRESWVCEILIPTT